MDWSRCTGTAPVRAFHGVEDQGVFCGASVCLSLGVSREPVVGKHCIWRAMIETVLEKIHLHPSHLPHRRLSISQFANNAIANYGK